MLNPPPKRHSKVQCHIQPSGCSGRVLHHPSQRPCGVLATTRRLMRALRIPAGSRILRSCTAAAHVQNAKKQKHRHFRSAVFTAFLLRACACPCRHASRAQNPLASQLLVAPFLMAQNCPAHFIWHLASALVSGPLFPVSSASTSACGSGPLNCVSFRSPCPGSSPISFCLLRAAPSSPSHLAGAPHHGRGPCLDTGISCQNTRTISRCGPIGALLYL